MNLLRSQRICILEENFTCILDVGETDVTCLTLLSADISLPSDPVVKKNEIHAEKNNEKHTWLDVRDNCDLTK